jgi:hypothetical protein
MNNKFLENFLTKRTATAMTRINEEFQKEFKDGI